MNSVKRARLISLLFFTGVIFFSGGQAWANNYPTKPIRFVVGYAPGGGVDLLGRLLAEKLSVALGQSVVVENRVGAGGTIGANSVARARPDGYTLLVGSASNVVIGTSLMPNVPYDPVQDFAPVIMTASVPLVLVVHASSPINSVQELLALAKSKPGSLNYASGGIGTAPHLAAALFIEMAGVDILNIPYNGDAPAVVALLAKDVSMMFAALPSVSSRLKSGDMKALGVALPRRLPTMPNLPTISESGVPGHEVNLWHGILAPAGTPKEIVKKLHNEIAKVLALPEVENRMQDLGFVRVGSTPEDFEAAIIADMKKWPALIKRSGAQTK